MKIEQIDLKAYGHFTAQRLALGSAANLHIICGPNEAGKTTLWRAINGALFGIPETTRDGHLHGNPKLRVGLALSSRGGERLAVMRRKGRVNTLLEYDPKTGDELAKTVPEERLHDWLGGLSQGLFLAMFSLDHDALVRGGAALAQGKGDAGESLFEAGAGLGSIRALRSRLDGEAEALFKPRARNSAIYRALSEYDETQRQAKDATVRPVEWTGAKAAMEAANKDYQTALAEQLRLQKEARRLERLAAILPDVAALELAQQQLAELASVPTLPPSAPSERVAAVTKKTEALSAEQTATQRLQQHQADLAAIQINDAVLADAEAIEAIRHATTTYREARIQSAKAEAASETAQGNFDFVLRQIAGDEKPVDPLQWIPDPTRTAKLRALITSGATLKATHQANLKTQREKKLEIDQLDAEILSLGQEDSSEDLAAYLDSIADYGDPEVRAQQLEDEATATEAKLNTDARGLKLAQLKPWPGRRSRWMPNCRSSGQKTKSCAAARIRSGRRSKKSRTISLPCRAISRGSKSVVTCRPEKPSSASATRATRSGSAFAAISCRPRANPCPADPPPAAERYEHAVACADDAADGLFADAERATRYAEFRVREAQMQNGHRPGKGTRRIGHQRTGSSRSALDRICSRAHGLPSLKISEAAQWVAKREAFLQKFDAQSGQAAGGTAAPPARPGDP
jgi:uncharacterized protein YhaN